MRILILTQYYPPEVGAPQVRLCHLARWLSQQGHGVEVLTSLPNYPTGRLFDGYPRYYIEEERDGILVHRSWVIPSNRRNLAHRLVSYLSFSVSSLVVGLTRTSRVDAVITESPPLFLGITGWLLASFKGARWVLNVSDLWPDSAKYISMLQEHGPIYRILQGIARFLYQRAWLVTGQSMEIVSEIRRQVPLARLYHLSNGVNPQHFHPQHRVDQIRQRYLKKGEVGFIYAGRHGFFQGLDSLIRAADRLRGRPVRFVFVGDGPEKETLVKRSRNLGLSNIDFYPSTPHEAIPSILSSMDVALIPLKSFIRGAVPSKIYEAMASGIPILLIGDGEASQIVQQSRAGVTVSPGEIDGLVLAICELAAKPKWCEELGKAGRAAAETLYDRSTIAEKFEAVLLERPDTAGFPAGEEGGVS